MNYSHILVATVISFFFGWLWHSPVLFLDYWLKLAGIPKPEVITAQMKKEMMRSMAIGFVINLVTAGALAYLIAAMNLTNMNSILALAVLVWLGFSATSMATPVVWEGRSIKLFVFNATYQLCATLVIAVVLSLLA